MKYPLKHLLGFSLLVGLTLFSLSELFAQRQMEYLNRGLVAVKTDQDAHLISWRWLGDEPEEIAFNIYRSKSNEEFVKLNKTPIGDRTNFLDRNIVNRESFQYKIAPVVGGVEGPASEPVNVWQENYMDIPLQTPEGYRPNDASVGDLDGDGDYEIILHQSGRGHDNSHTGLTDPPILEAYEFDGTLLWRINLGINIREGAHYTQFMVYDLDGDGRAEVACKTSDGTVDGTGKIIGNADSVYRYPENSLVEIAGPGGRVSERKMDGYILRGPEYLTVFDGLTGKAITTTDYLPSRHPDTDKPTSAQLAEIWGDGYGNRIDRFLACIAYLDGKHPSLVMSRGYYTRSVLAAWDFKDGELAHRWTFDSEDGTSGNDQYSGQGNHNLSVGDVDNDGKDEIIYGAAVIDDDGTGLYSTGLGHGDAIHLSDLDPTRPGLEVFNIQERFDDAGANFRAAETGEILWKKPSVKAGRDGEGPGRGVSFNIDPRYPGNESWVRGANITGLFDAKGNLISEKQPSSCNFAVWWDNDLLRELLNKNEISKWDWRTQETKPLLVAEGFTSNNGSKSTPALSGDLIGDWREEVILRSSDNQSLRIYTTPYPTNRRFRTFMHDPVYRLSITWQNVAYNQPPHPSFYIGEEMEKPKAPDIRIIKAID